MTPVEASHEVNENKVWRNLFAEFCRTIMILKFSIGDNVRITKKKKLLTKATHKDELKRFFQFKNSIDISGNI